MIFQNQCHSALGRMIARILGSVAQGEGEVKSERWRRSIRQRREAGVVHTMGPRLYGYERDGTIREDEREHIEWAAGQILDGAAIIPDPRNQLVKAVSEMAWMDYYVRGKGEKFNWRLVLATLEDAK